MRSQWILVLLIFLLILIMLDITIRIIPWTQPKPSPRCLSIPTRFVLDYPECAGKLIQMVNLANIRIVSLDTHIFQQQEYAKLYLRNASVK